ncbi:MAG: hypothetical protein ABH875_06625, partial [Candidatus Omnitrophota bacterium]
DNVYPFSWEHLQSERVLFSLGHVDTRMKIILQDIAEAPKIAARYGKRCPQLLDPEDVPQLAERAHRIFTHLLKSNDYSWTGSICNLLAVNLQDRIIEMLVGETRYEAYRNNVLASILASKNDAALKNFERIIPVDQVDYEIEDRRMHALSIWAGVCFPQDMGQEAFKPTDEFTWIMAGDSGDTHMGINHIDEFNLELAVVNDAFDHNPGTAKRPELAFLIDDVGEAIPDLIKMQALLKRYKHLVVTISINTYPVEHNMWTGELDRLMKHDYFGRLRGFREEGRFRVRPKRTTLLCPDPRFIPNDVMDWLKGCTAVYLKGAAPFETTQLRDVNTYYGFVNYHQATSEVTGLPTHKGVFVHVPRGYEAFEYIPSLHAFKTTKEILVGKSAYQMITSMLQNFGDLLLTTVTIVNNVLQALRQYLFPKKADSDFAEMIDEIVSAGEDRTADQPIYPLAPRGKKRYQKHMYGRKDDTRQDEQAAPASASTAVEPILTEAGSIVGGLMQKRLTHLLPYDGTTSRATIQHTFAHDANLLISLPSHGLTEEYIGEGMIYKIRVNSDWVDKHESQYKMLKLWVQALSERYRASTFELIANGDSSNGLIHIESTRAPVIDRETGFMPKRSTHIGSSSLSVSVAESFNVDDLDLGYRIPKTFLLAFAASNIPDKLDSWNANAKDLASFISTLYASLTGEEGLFVDIDMDNLAADEIEEIIRRKKEIKINLPPIHRLDFDSKDEFEMAREALKAA